MNNPEVVLCDIDGVLGDLSVPVVAAINRAHGTEYKPSDWTTWEWPMEQLALLARYDLPTAALWAFSNENIAQAVPVAEAQHVLSAWSEQGTQIHVATSRPPTQRDVTMQWLAQHYPFIPEGNINIRTSSDVKGNAFKRQHAERLVPQMYFEDEGAAMALLLQSWPANLQSILRLIDQPWNRPFRELDPYRTTWSALR